MVVETHGQCVFFGENVCKQLYPDLIQYLLLRCCQIAYQQIGPGELMRSSRRKVKKVPFPARTFRCSSRISFLLQLCIVEIQQVVITRRLIIPSTYECPCEESTEVDQVSHRSEGSSSSTIRSERITQDSERNRSRSYSRVRHDWSSLSLVILGSSDLRKGPC